MWDKGLGCGEMTGKRRGKTGGEKAEAGLRPREGFQKRNINKKVHIPGLDSTSYASLSAVIFALLLP